MTAAILASTLDRMAVPGATLTKHDAELFALAGRIIAAQAAERAEAVRVARYNCERFDLWTGWPDNLHLADIIDKRLCNLLRPLHLEKIG